MLMGRLHIRLHSIFLLQYVAVILLFVTAHSQTLSQPLSSAKVVFTKLSTPTGWKRYSSNSLTTGVLFGNGPASLPPEFRSYVRESRGYGFTYEQLLAPGTYDVTTGFIEQSNQPCRKTAIRLFSIKVNDKLVENINIFSKVGCFKPYTIKFTNVVVGSEAFRTQQSFAPSSTPSISNIQTKSNPGTSVTPLASPSATFVVAKPSPSVATDFLGPSPVGDLTTEEVVVNAGSGSISDTNLPSTFVIETDKFVFGTAHAASTVYRTARGGMQFDYSFNVKPGIYNISLGFVEFQETICAGENKRIFDVYINNEPYLKNFDIFAQAGCFRGIEKSYTTIVSQLSPKPIIISFRGISTSALISLIYIRAASQECVPESTSGQLSADHAAHAVPGQYPPRLTLTSPRSYVDSNKDGFVSVLIDGGKSHTHYNDLQNNINGRITDFTWILVETGEIISRQPSFRYPFPHGVTRIRLTVVDNFCSVDQAETKVTITGPLNNGIYCYFYENSNELLEGGTLLDYPRPNYALLTKTSSFNFPEDSFSQFLYATRCFFSIEQNTELPDARFRLSTFETGVAKLYKGTELLIDTSISSLSNPLVLASGYTRFEVVFKRRSRTTSPKLRILLNENPIPSKRLVHDRNLVVPIVKSITPRDGQTSGETTITITGYGLYQPLRVWFGENKATILNTVGTSIRQFVIRTPPSNFSGSVDIVVKTGSGRSTNAGKFSYSNECDSVGFHLNALRQPNGKHLDYLNFPTSVTLWQDGRLYFGTLSGRVQVIGYNRFTLQTSSHCYSDVVGDRKFLTPGGSVATRSILGLTFDPRDKTARPYISTSTLFPLAREAISASNIAWWRNGAVDRLRPGTNASDGKVCLVYDKRIVSNLPVSNHDHSVNTLLFTQKGDLLIAQGGNTNGGLPSKKFGGLWDTALSGSVLIARLSNPAFDGQIKYESKLHHFTARKKSGNVGVFASGLRNLFGMTMTVTGDIYGIDQGTNCAFGDVATSCSEFDYSKALTWNISGPDWPGQIYPKAGGCKRTAKRPDKMVHITKGAFYGHPNFFRQSDECAWIDPYSDATADGGPPPQRYKKPLAFLESSVTGIVQYNANHFCNRLKGDLVMSSYKGGAVYRAAVKGADKTVPSVLAGPGWGGIASIQDEFGNLITPRLNEKKVSVLKPRISEQYGTFVTALSPFRHGAQGGTILSIGGGGFVNGLSVKVGGKPCAVQVVSWSRIRCVVPAHTEGTKDLAVTVNDKTVHLWQSVLYMSA